MKPSNHQPQELPVVRPPRAAQDLQSQCGNAVAVIMAIDVSTIPLVVTFDEEDRPPITLEPTEGADPLPRPLQIFEGKPIIEYALEAATHAQVGAITILTATAIHTQIQQTVNRFVVNHADCANCSSKPIAPIAIMAYESISEDAHRTVARSGQDMDLFGMTYPQLAAVHKATLIAEKNPERNANRFDSVFIMRADMPRITANHLFELAQDFNEHPSTQVVTSWIQWLRRAPYLIDRDYLDETLNAAEKRFATKKSASVVHITVRDHVFGEEHLAANDTTPTAVLEFFDECTINALQAVRLAKYARIHPDEKLVSPNQTPSLLGPVEHGKLSYADYMLINTARETLERLEANTPAEEQAEITWADAFGTRNKRDFTLLNDRTHKDKLVYLDTAATAQRLDAAIQAQHDYDLHENANIYRGAYELSTRSTFTYNDARKRLEDFIGAERRTTAFTANTTASCNIVARSWGEYNIGAGDTIITTIAEHHSNMLPFAMLAQRKGAHVIYLPIDDNGRIDQRAYEQALKQHPKLVCVAQVGNVIGMHAPIGEMTRKAHAIGARVLVDAAQSFSRIKINVKALDCDFLVFSAHKAYGPMGLGGLWIAPSAFAEMDPMCSGGGAVSHVSTESYYLRPKVIQYEWGTPPVSQAVGFAAAIDYLDALGMDNVARHDSALTRYLTRGLQTIDSVQVWGDHLAEDGTCGLVSFTVCGVQPSPLAQFLGKLDVAIRSGGHCALPLHASMGLIGTGRISIGVYTTAEDIEAALTAVALCARLYRGE